MRQMLTASEHELWDSLQADSSLVSAVATLAALFSRDDDGSNDSNRWNTHDPDANHLNDGLNSNAHNPKQQQQQAQKLKNAIDGAGAGASEGGGWLSSVS